MTKSLVERLASIQSKLNAPKNQVNKFGGYNYRSCEDILQAVKPLLSGLVITINDDIVVVADRVYVKATSTITDGENSISTTAFAREALSKKGQDEAQTTGSASSYARKYSLNALLLIDDNKDADSQDNREHQAPQGMTDDRVSKAIEACKSASSRDDLTKYYQSAQKNGANAEQLKRISAACSERMNELQE